MGASGGGGGDLPPAHRALFGDPVEALSEDMKFAVLGQQLDLHARPGLLLERDSFRQNHILR